MPYFPFFINIENMRCVIIGGGQVALRKIEKLMPFKPEITVIAPEICQEIRDIRGLSLMEREYADEDIADAFFVIAATDDTKTNIHISKLCKERNIMCNAVDIPESCTFYFPALVQNGDITVGISTSGKSPLLASYLRKQIEGIADERFAEICCLMGDIRPYVREMFSEEADRKSVLSSVLQYCLSKEYPPDKQELYKFIQDIKEQLSK